MKKIKKTWKSGRNWLFVDKTVDSTKNGFDDWNLKNSY